MIPILFFFQSTSLPYHLLKQIIKTFCPLVLILFFFFKQLCTSNIVSFCDLGSSFAAVCHGGRRKPPTSTSPGGCDAEGED